MNRAYSFFASSGQNVWIGALPQGQKIWCAFLAPSASPVCAAASQTKVGERIAWTQAAPLWTMIFELRGGVGAAPGHVSGEPASNRYGYARS